jgi:hypothetical protein
MLRYTCLSSICDINLLDTSSKWMSTLSLAMSRAMLAWHKRMTQLIDYPTSSQVEFMPVSAASKGLGIDKNRLRN